MGLPTCPPTPLANAGAVDAHPGILFRAVRHGAFRALPPYASYTLADEPYPDTFFDLPVAPPV